MQHFIHFISLYLNHFASTTANNTSNRYLLYTFYLFCFLFVFLEYHVSLCAAFLKVARFEKLRVAYPAADCDLPYSARVFYLISSLARSADDSNTCHRLTATKHKYMYVVSARLSIFVCVYFCTFIYLLPSAEVSLSPLAETNVRRYCRHTLCWIHIIGAINLPYSTYTVIHTHTNTNAIVYRYFHTYIFIFLFVCFCTNAFAHFFDFVCLSHVSFLHNSRCLIFALSAHPQWFIFVQQNTSTYAHMFRNE